MSPSCISTPTVLCMYNKPADKPRATVFFFPASSSSRGVAQTPKSAQNKTETINDQQKKQTMAIHRDGLMEEDDNEQDNGLFGEAGIHDLDSDTPPHLRELALAAQVGDVDALRQALDNLNGSIDEPLEDGDTALHLVCLYGYFPSAQLLIERGADLEAKDEDGAIPLHDACASGFTEIAQLLLNSANSAERVKRMLETVDAEGDTPLHHAARGEHPEVIRLLLASGASATATNLYGKTPGDLPEQGTEARRILESAANAIPCQ